jgi:hypothetical protein
MECDANHLKVAIYRDRPSSILNGLLPGTQCSVGSSSSFVAVGRPSGSLLLTGGLLVRVQPEEPPRKALQINTYRTSQIAVSNFHNVSCRSEIFRSDNAYLRK